MQTFIFDAGPLITACKFEVDRQAVIDHLLAHCQIVVAESVRDEVVVAGARYADAQIAKERIDNGKISVLAPEFLPDLTGLIAPYKLGQGEQDSLLLVNDSSLQNPILVVDDHLAFLVSTRLGQSCYFLLDAIVELTRMANMDKDRALKLVTAIHARYPTAFVEHTRLLLLQR